MALTRGTYVAVTIIAILIILALLGVFLWLLLGRKEGFPTNIRLMAQGKQWFLFWDPPSNQGNTGPLQYRIEVTATSGPNNGQTRHQEGITQTNVLFPFQDPGNYTANVYAYTATQTSPPGSASVTIFGAPIVESFDFVNQSSINFSSPIQGLGKTQVTGAKLTSVDSTAIVISNAQGVPAYTLQGTGTVASDGYSFQTLYQIPQVTSYLIHDDVNPSQTAIMTANLSSGIVYPVSTISPLALWTYDGSTVALIQDTSYRWTLQQNQDVGAIVLGVTTDPSQYGVVKFNPNGITTISTPLGIYNILYDIATSPNYIFGSQNASSAIAPTNAPFTTLLEGGMTYRATAQVSNEFGTTSAQTPTYSIQPIAPSAPQNVRLVYQ